MTKFVIDIKVIDDRLVIVDARNGQALYEIGVTDTDDSEADNLIDKIDQGISEVLRYRVIAAQDKAAKEAAAETKEVDQKSGEIVIKNSIDYFTAISSLMSDYPDVFNMDTDIAMKNIVDMAIQFNVDSYELGVVVYTYMHERRKMLEEKVLQTMVDNITKNYPR